MRNIKFRAKSLTAGEWVCGGYYNMDDCRKGGRRHIIAYDNNDNCGQQTPHDPIDINTLGQYTGLKDKNDKEIYEGDILAPDSTCRGSNRYIIEWNDKHCCFTSIEGGIDDFIGDLDEEIQFNLLSNMKLNVCEIVGNIYDNPKEC